MSMARTEHASNTNSIPLRWRVLAMLAAGLSFGVLCRGLLLTWSYDVQANDFTYPWLGARALVHGLDPYVAVASAHTPWGFGLFYPVPALLLAAPFAWLPAPTAAAMFIGLSFGFLAFVLTRHDLWRLLLLASAPAAQACISVQWSPLLTAAALFPAALGIVVAKPNFVLPLLAFQTRPKAWYLAAIGAAMLTIASFVAIPSWPLQWVHALRSNAVTGQYAIPVASDLGWVVLLAALRWRRPEARLLLFMACVPQTGFFYDQLPLLLIPTGRIELVIAVIASDVAYALALHAQGGGLGVGMMSTTIGFPYMIVGVYIPALVIVLRRSNVGAAPVWAERVTSRLPPWIAGTDAQQA
jgi:hypothetical protein